MFYHGPVGIGPWFYIVAQCGKVMPRLETAFQVCKGEVRECGRTNGSSVRRKWVKPRLLLKRLSGLRANPSWVNTVTVVYGCFKNVIHKRISINSNIAGPGRSVKRVTEPIIRRSKWHKYIML